MFQELFQNLGLSLNEARVYEALLIIGENNVNNISIKSKVHRRNVYDSLNKLIEKGLASENFVHKERLFKPTNPQRLAEILAEQQSTLTTKLPELQKLYTFIEPQVEAYIFRGIEGFKTYLQLILKENQPVYFIGAKALWLDPRLQYYLPHFQTERKKKNIQFYHLFDHEIKEQKPEILKTVGKPYKFLPKKYSSSTCIDIFGDYVVTFVGAKPGELYEEPIQFVLKNKLLAEGYRKFFQFMWDFCPEPKE